MKDQRSFYEIRSLAIFIIIKAFNRVNRKQLNIWNIWDFISVLTEDDSALKIV